MNNFQKHILVVDDHPLTRLGAVVTLQKAGFLISETDNEQKALEMANDMRLDGAVLDLRIFKKPGDQNSGYYGLSLGHKLKKIFPQIGIVFWSSYDEFIPEIWDMVGQGICGLAFQHKASKDQLLIALTKAMAGELFIEKDIREPDINPLSEILLARLTDTERELVEMICDNFERGVLTGRETEVANLLANSLTYEGIGDQLYIELSTVGTYANNVYSKLGIGEIDKTLRKNVVLAKAFTLVQLRRRATQS